MTKNKGISFTMIVKLFLLLCIKNKNKNKNPLFLMKYICSSLSAKNFVQIMLKYEWYISN